MIALVMKRSAISIVILFILIFGLLFADKQKESIIYFSKAIITEDSKDNSGNYFKFNDEAAPSVNEFLSE